MGGFGTVPARVGRTPLHLPPSLPPIPCSRLHTSLPPAALRAIQQRLAAQHTKQQPMHSQPTRDDDPRKAAAPPTTPVPG